MRINPLVVLRREISFLLIRLTRVFTTVAFITF